MGVRSLQSFIKENGMLVPHRLSNTKVIIDGDNLANLLHSNHTKHSQDYVTNGNYDSYAEMIAEFCRKLLECGLEPIFIFDGGMEATRSKLETRIKRLQNILDGLVKVYNGLKSSTVFSESIDVEFSILPMFFKEVLVSVLDELGIRYLQAFTDADSHMASLANALGCPVVSNDSDFVVLDVAAGFVLLDSMFDNGALKVSKSAQKPWILGETRKYDSWKDNTTPSPAGDCLSSPYIECEIFHSKNLLKHFPGLTAKHLPLFACLAGNEHVSSIDVTVLHERHGFEITVSKFPFEEMLKSQGIEHLAFGMSPLQLSKRRFKVIARALSWIQQYACVFDVKQIENIAYGHLIKPEFLNQGFSANLPELFRFSIEQYRKSEQSSYLLRILDSNRLDADAFCSQIEDEIGIRFELDFLERFCKKQIPNEVIDIMVAKVAIGKVGMSELTLPPYSNCSRDLYRHYFGLLQSNSKQNSETKSASKSIRLYDRSLFDGNLKVLPKKLDPIVLKGVTLETLSELDSAAKRQLILNALNATEADWNGLLCSSDLKLLVLVLKYWLKQIEGSGRKNVKEFVDAFVWMLVFGGLVLLEKDKGNAKESDKSTQKQNFVREWLEIPGMSPDNVALKELVKYFKERFGKRNSIGSLNLHFVHYYGEIQSILYVVSRMNKLLNKPFQFLRVDHFFNGDLLHNLAVELRENGIGLSRKWASEKSSLALLFELVEISIFGKQI